FFLYYYAPHPDLHSFPTRRSSDLIRQLGIKGLADLLQAGFDHGVTFWDSADQYGSHPHLKEGLRRVAREKVTILTKTRATTADEDRKSTRLNSSHVSISYAVFCLK